MSCENYFASFFYLHTIRAGSMFVSCCYKKREQNAKKVHSDIMVNFVRRALEEGASKGRGGKGSIFVWASGNGGKS